MMTDDETRHDRRFRDEGVNGEVIRQAPSVSLAFFMLSQAGTLARDQLAASAAAQRDGIGAMIELVRQSARAPGLDNGIRFKEANDLGNRADAAARAD